MTESVHKCFGGKGGGGDAVGQRSVFVRVRVSVGLEVLRQSFFFFSLRRAVVVKEKTPALLGLNITG